MQNNIILPSGKEITLHTPTEIKAYLDRFVVGQENAKKVLSTAVYNHYKRVYLNTQTSLSTKVDKSNIILSGPTGSGKTFIIKKLAEFMQVPYYIADATTMTQAGYAGDDVESMLSGLLRAANYKLNEAQCGIVFIDEIDKIAKRSLSNKVEKDPVGEGVQQALLKLVEGETVGVPPQEGRKHPEQQLIYVDTTNILFIVSGSFAGIEPVIRKRISSAGVIGFKTPNDNVITETSEIPDSKIFEYLNQEDLRKFGFIPEFIGRFPIITNVEPLTKEDLVTISSVPENNILDQYATLLAFDGIELNITEDALKYIAETAIKLKTGARSLRSLFECIMEDYMFELPGSNTSSITINEAYVKEKIDARYKNIKE